MDNELHHQDGNRVEIPEGYVVEGPPWHGHQTWDCGLCPPGYLRDHDLVRMLKHLEKEHGVLLGEQELNSAILGADGKPMKKRIAASVFPPEERRTE